MEWTSNQTLIPRDKCTPTICKYQAHCFAILDSFVALLSDLALISCAGFNGYCRDTVQIECIRSSFQTCFKSSEVQPSVGSNPLQ